MAAKDEAKVKFTAETSDFNANIKKSAATMSNLRSELKLNETQLAETGDQSEYLSNKQKILEAQVEQSKNKVDALSGKVEAAAKIYGENSEQVQKYQTELNNALSAESKIQAALNDCNAEIDSQKTAFAKLATEISDQEQKLSALKSEYSNVVLEQGDASEAAKDLAGKIGSLSSDLEDNKSKMSDAKDAADKLDSSLGDVGDAAKESGGKVEKSADGYTVLKDVVSDLATGVITGAIDGIKDLGTEIYGLADETREYRAEQNKMDAAFQANGYSAETAKNTYKTLFGVLADETASATAASNLSIMGLEQSKLESLTHSMIGIWSQYGDSIPLDGLAESVNETAKVSAVTGNLADALNWAGINEDSFNEQLVSCSTEQERQQLIIDTLNGKYGNLADSYLSNNENIVAANDANADYQDTIADMGAKIEPVTTSIKSGFAGVLETVGGLIDGADISGWADTITGAFGWLSGAIVGVVGGIKDTVKWMQENKTLLGIVAVVVGSLTAGIAAYNIVQGIKTAMDAANATSVWGLVTAQLASNAAMLASPITWVVAGIVALIAIMVLLVTHWDAVKEGLLSVWNAIKDAASAIFGAIKNVITGIWDSIKNYFTTIFEVYKTIFSTAFNAIKTIVTTVFNAIKTVATTVWDGIKTVIITPITTAKDTVTSIIDTIKDKVSSVFNSIKNTVTNVWDGIKSAITTPIEAAKNIVSGIIDKIKGFFSFKISWPNIPTPHFGISPAGWKIGDLLHGSIPKLSIKWYAAGGVFDQPTLLHGVGEAGPEAVAPIAVLQNYVSTAVAAGMQSLNMDRMASAIENLANKDTALYVDSTKIATATAASNDNVSGQRITLKNRGVALP